MQDCSGNFKGEDVCKTTSEILKEKTMEEIKGTKAHRIYKNLLGITVPSVTTVLSLLNKPALIKWANNLGLQGINSTRYKDKLAEAGSLAHQLILDYFRGIKTDTSDYSKDTIDKAENSFLSFLEWTKGKKIKSIFIEKYMVSEKYGFGGTLDFYGEIDKDLVVSDYKTGSGIYPEFIYQLSAYRELVEEQGFKVKKVTVIRIPRSSDEQFETKDKINTEKEWQIFLHLLGIYYLKKEIKEEKE